MADKKKKWWEFWASDKAPAPGRAKPIGGKSGSGRVPPPPSPKKRMPPGNGKK